jgi:[ribosomal protein S5]-alanine N-acetyltransferase
MTTTLITPDVERAVIAPPPHHAPVTISPAPLVATGITADWRQALPRLVGERLTLRGLQTSDAGSLLSLLTTDEVSRFLSPPPTTIDGFERFITWTNRKRQEGSYLCFGVVPKGMDVAVGVFQLRALDAAFNGAEWGFALGRPFWGTGLFVEGATHTLDFAFGSIGVQRLEARSALGNGRGNGALRKIGAVHEAVLRRSFHKHGQVHDQALWSILDIDWFATRGRVLGLPIQPPQRWH